MLDEIRSFTSHFGSRFTGYLNRVFGNCTITIAVKYVMILLNQQKRNQRPFLVFPCWRARVGRISCSSPSHFGFTLSSKRNDSTAWQYHTIAEPHWPSNRRCKRLPLRNEIDLLSIVATPGKQVSVWTPVPMTERPSKGPSFFASRKKISKIFTLLF